MRVRFVGSGEPGENLVCEVFGHAFPLGEWVNLTPIPPKLMANPAFEVDPDGDGEDGPDIEEVRARLDELGVNYHPRTGLPKLVALLAEHTPPAEPEPDPAEVDEGEGA